jgi:hypothetical protein
VASRISSGVLQIQVQCIMSNDGSWGGPLFDRAFVAVGFPRDANE